MWKKMRLICGQVRDFKPLSSLFFFECNVLESDSISLAQREGWIRQRVKDAALRTHVMEVKMEQMEYSFIY